MSYRLNQLFLSEDLLTEEVRSSPGFTSSEQQARTQSRSDRTTRASMAVVDLFNACLTLMIAFWCCLEKHVSGSVAEAGRNAATIIQEVKTSSRGLGSSGDMADLHSDQKRFHNRRAAIHTNVLQEKSAARQSRRQENTKFCSEEPPQVQKYKPHLNVF